MAIELKHTVFLIILCCGLRYSGGVGTPERGYDSPDKLASSSGNDASIIPAIPDINIIMRDKGQRGNWWSDKLDDVISVYARQGTRSNMEDRYSIKRKGDILAFAIFDGHSGTGAAKNAAKSLLASLIYKMNRETSEATDEIIRDFIPKFNGFSLEKGHVKENNGVYPGSTALIGVVHKGKLYVANVGDSRAIAIDNNGYSEAITNDHNAKYEKERERIEAAGGIVQEIRGVWRVGYDAAVSRSLGDYHLTDFGMTADPDVFVMDLADERTQYVVLATDGVWDYISTIGAGETIINNSEDELFGAKQLVDRAGGKRCHDNVTVMVVRLAAVRAWLWQISAQASADQASSSQ